MKAPNWDQGFPTHSVHGKLMQADFIRRVTLGLPRRRVALDVGAHIGLTALALAESFRVVIAFEPVIENYECLLANVACNEKIATYNVGLFDSEGTGDFALPPGETNSGCWHLQQIGSLNQTPLYALDSFKFNKVDFIKLDTEGTEGMVLEGAHETIDRCRPRIVFEDNGLGGKYYGSQWVDPKMVLEEHGYERIDRIRKDEVWAPR